MYRLRLTYGLDEYGLMSIRHFKLLIVCAEMTASGRSPNGGLGQLSCLPAEIRNNINSFVLFDNSELHYEHSDLDPDLPDLALLYVCKNINQEATPVLYNNATFQSYTNHSSNTS